MQIFLTSEINEILNKLPLLTSQKNKKLKFKFFTLYKNTKIKKFYLFNNLKL